MAFVVNAPSPTNANWPSESWPADWSGLAAPSPHGDPARVAPVPLAGESRPNPAPSPVIVGALRAWTPYILVAALLLVTRLRSLPIGDWLRSWELGLPSILEVQVTRDLAYARVYFSVLNPEDADGCLRALNRAGGFLQREIGKRLKARVTPKLSFIYDDTDIRGRELENLIDSAVASDRDKAGS